MSPDDYSVSLNQNHFVTPMEQLLTAVIKLLFCHFQMTHSLWCLSFRREHQQEQVCQWDFFTS